MAVENTGYKHDQLTELVEDAVGAEFVSAVEITEVIGSEFELLADLHSAIRQFWQNTQSDYRQTMDSLARLQSSDELALIVNTHLRQRLSHSLSLVETMITSTLSEQQKVLNIHAELWAPFFDTLNQDLQTATVCSDLRRDRRDARYHR